MGKRYELVGEKFGKLTVIEKINSDPNSKRKVIKWKCNCDCGKESIVPTCDLISGKTQQCWDCAHLASGMAKRKSRIGERIGHLTIIDEKYTINSKGRHRKKYICKCDCGNIITRDVSSKDGENASCGCAKKEIVRNSCGRNIDGLTFGRLTVLRTLWEEAPPKVECRCDCGSTIIIPKSYVQSRHTMSCGCLQKDRASESNTVFHYEYVSPYGVKLIRQAKKNNCGQWLWECECSCGNIFVELPAKIKNGHVRSCGCVRSSSNETMIAQILDDNHIEYKREYTFEDLKSKKNYRLRFDFAIHKKDGTILLIEEQGQQHFKPIDYFGGEVAFKENVERDNLKREYCKNNKIQLLELPYYLTYDEVKNTIINTIYA